ncbi:uncharacterized protein CDV56_100977 [Aspergillus thermomutatus]|uniref:serine C-palmitoyltransferase n=1 Tax=Aspergillus thermomutatus TaxID=41047 RepID=A0A397G750_ASPTH|nr:uncharacterized protein CDV56_100977 [Aspergillus thermomutatus]RHZ45196.1 hypothetical protein CDV56_100977 [Aspergillus thermomutatus]
MFSVTNHQSLISQLQDAASVLRTIIRTTRQSPSPANFIRQYILQPTFRNDFFVLCYAFPALSCTPRILDAAPTVRSDMSDWSYEGTRVAVGNKNVLNIASSSQLGFVDLEFNTRKLLEYAIQNLPFADNCDGCNAGLEEAVKDELKRFMGFEGCVLTSIGYQFNLVAFAAMAMAASSCEETVFLMDSGCHNSMYAGAYIACAKTKGKVVRWQHNDAVDLERKLQHIYGNDDSTASKGRKNVWVTILGFYSMLAAVPCLDAIITLKRQYGFNLYVDEAVSFLGLGHTGRGIGEFFQDRGAAEIGVDDIDMMGCTFSKSLSSMGGFVLCRAPLTSHLEASNLAIRAAGGGYAATASLIRTLQILKKPTLITQRLVQLRQVSSYLIDGLEARGYQIAAMRGSSTIALFLDNVHRMFEFLKHARTIGLICTGAAFPAAPRGRPLIRLLLTGLHTSADIDEILNKIDRIAKAVGVRTAKRMSSQSGKTAPDMNISNSAIPADDNFTAAKSSDDVDASILAVCPQPIRSLDSKSAAIRARGVSALSKFGLGAQGARWTWGTFSAHLSLEKLLLTTFIPMMSSYLPRNMALNPMETMLFPDPYTGILSIVSQNMECLTKRRRKKGQKVLMLLPEASGADVRDGVAAARPDKSVKVRWYTCLSLQSILQQEYEASSGKVHLILCIDLKFLVDQGRSRISENGRSLDSLIASELCEALKALGRTTPLLSLTLIVNDPYMFSSGLSSTHALLSTLASSTLGVFSSSTNPSSTSRFLLFGSFDSLPYVSGLQGAFCIGSQHLVQKLLFMSQGVMYTAMMLPLNAAMVEESIMMIISERSKDSGPVVPDL